MKNRGYSLIELMIVIVIIGIVAAMIVPAFTNRDTVQSAPAYSVQPTPAGGEHSCENGLLLKNGQPVVKDGIAVRC